MAIDYSKWDHLEISDDSDIEVHPNVDKKSMIRWKQQQLHEQRAQRNHDIQTLEVQKNMYQELNKRVDQILSEIDDSKLADYGFITTYLAENFDPVSKPEGIEEDGPTHNEMIEDLFTQLKKDLEKEGRDPSDGSRIREMIQAHRKKIDDVLSQNLAKLETLYKERDQVISSEDIHTGWDRSFLNKGDSKPDPSSSSKPIEKSTAPISTPSYSTPSSATTTTPTESPVQSSTTTAATPKQTETTTSTVSDSLTSSSKDAEEEIGDLDPDTVQYSKLPINKIDQIKAFLKSHTHIIRLDQKDALLMSAFDAQFAQDDNKTYQIIYLSTLLQYIHDIIEFKKTRNSFEIGQIVEQLLSKMFTNTANPAYEAFQNEVERTFNHIKERCKILSQEQQQDEENQEIQIKSLDENTELVVNLPNPESTDPEEIKKYKSFQKLPKNMRDALKTGSLDAVNEVFHGMPIAEAEEILAIFEECEVIGVEALIENEGDWQEIKNEYEKSQESENASSKKVETEPKIQELDINDQENFESSADIVD